jgi:hypothetical protein
MNHSRTFAISRCASIAKNCRRARKKGPRDRATAPGITGLCVIPVCCVGDLSTAPGFGAMLAEWIVNGGRPMDLSFLAPSGLPEHDLHARRGVAYAGHCWPRGSMARAAAE